jgi:alpha-1,3-rhamnosyl/mannosyltransferase
LPPRYLLCLGTIEPRKNILRLLDAYHRLPRSWRGANPLILAGMPGWGAESFWTTLRDHPVAPEVLRTGFLTDAQVAGLVRCAKALLYPSLYEGFGLPPLEAMALGVPTAVSTTPAVREVCAGASLLVDPEDVEAWSQVMVRISSQGAERDRLIEQGWERARQFQWSRVAERHAALIERIAIGSTRRAAA